MTIVSIDMSGQTAALTVNMAGQISALTITFPGWTALAAGEPIGLLLALTEAG